MPSGLRPWPNINLSSESQIASWKHTRNKDKIKISWVSTIFPNPARYKNMIHISFRTFSSLLTILQSLKEKRKQNTERMGSWKKFRKHIFQLQSTSSKQIPIRKVENLHPNKNRKKCFFFSSFVRLALNNFLRFFVIR